MKEDAFLPQYAAQAVIDLERWQKHSQAPSKFYREACKQVARLIRDSVHVVLPPNGEIYRSNTPSGGEMPNVDECDSFAGLPAPVTTFEYQWVEKPNLHDLDAAREGRPTEAAPKRITVAVDGFQISESEAPVGQVHVVQLFSVFYSELQKVWCLLDHSIAVERPLSVSMRDKSRGPWDWGVNGNVKSMLDGRAYSASTAEHEFKGDISATVQCCHALRAGASLIESSELSSSRRKKFEKKGVGGFTYHVLTLPTAGRISKVGTGTHASPRLHVRRAHIRKLSSGALTFVRQCLVGDPSAGAVNKHYKVTGPIVSHVEGEP